MRCFFKTLCAFFCTILFLGWVLVGCNADDDDDSSSDTVDDDDDDNDDNNDDDNDDNNNDTGPVFEDPAPSDRIGVFVAKSGSDSNPGTMALPKRTLEAGLALAEAQNKVLFVGQGTYIESVTVTVSMYGGYEETGWTRDIKQNATILKSFMQERTLYIPPSAGELEIDGFSIPGDNHGFSAFAIVAEGGDITLRRNTIITPDIYAPFIIITAVSLKVGSATLENNTIIAGQAQGIMDPTYAYSTGLEIEADNIVMVNNLIVGGDAPDGFLGTTSTGLKLECDTATLVNNTIVSNDAEYSSALIVKALSQVDLINNIFTCGQGNSPVAIMIENGKFLFRNNNLHSPVNGCLLRTPAIQYRNIGLINDCTWLGCRDAGANIAKIPKFAGSNNYHLQNTSECIDSGVNPEQWCDQPIIGIDLDGDPRPMGSAWDIGMDEFQGY